MTNVVIRTSAQSLRKTRAHANRGGALLDSRTRGGVGDTAIGAHAER